MRYFVIFMLAVLSIAVSSTRSAMAAAYTVHIANFAYTPKVLQVKVGDTITFINDDPEAHTVTATNGKIHSGPIYYTEKWTLHVKDAGTIQYFCAPHRYMTGTIVVRP